MAVLLRANIPLPLERDVAFSATASPATARPRIKSERDCTTLLVPEPESSNA
jgi:hypothetical protein